MSIKKYEVFLKTVDLGSLTKAAQVLGYSQSALSHMLAGLEDELGVRLLLRGRGGVRLSEEGERLLPAIRSICREQQELLRQVAHLHGLEVGCVRIGSILSVSVHLLPRMIHAFSERHPHITFEILQGNYEDMALWIAEGRIDCGILRLPIEGALETIPLTREKLLAVFPADRDVPPGAFRWEEGREEPYILRPDTLEGELSKFFKKAGTPPKITYSAKDDYAVMAMVEEGLGMSILPELLLKGASHCLQKRELDPPVYRELGLAYKNLQGLSPVAHQFINFVRRDYPLTQKT